MYYFCFDREVDPRLSPLGTQGRTALIIRWGESPNLRMLIYGPIGAPPQVRAIRLANGRPGFEINIQVANAWQVLSPGDEVFIYDPTMLTSAERSELMLAVSKMLVGESIVGETELDEAVLSILDTYRD